VLFKLHPKKCHKGIKTQRSGLIFVTLSAVGKTRGLEQMVNNLTSARIKAGPCN